MLSHILGWFLFVICFFKKNAFSFCPTIQTKRPNFNFPPFLCVSVRSVQNIDEPASCCPKNKSSGQCSTLCLCRSSQTHEESEKLILSPKIVAPAAVFSALEGSGKNFITFSCLVLASQDLERSGYCVLVFSRIACTTESPATKFYFGLLKGSYFRVDQHGLLAYLQISSWRDYKLVDSFCFGWVGHNLAI